MGGRGARSASSIARGVESYRVVHGDAAVARLRKKGASDSKIAAIYDSYRKNRESGMGKRDSRIKAESDAGFPAAKRKKRSGGTSGKSEDLSGAFVGNEQQSTTRLNGYGEATSRYITSASYERAMRRQKRNLDKWFGRGMG